MAGSINQVRNQSPRKETFAQQTRAEHDALLEAMHRLEAALAAAAPGREREWNSRAFAALRTVHKALETHIASAEGPQGLFAELDLTRPALVRRVERLRHDHFDLLQRAEGLL